MDRRPGASLGDILGAALEAKSSNTTTDRRKKKIVKEKANKIRKKK